MLLLGSLLLNKSAATAARALESAPRLVRLAAARAARAVDAVMGLAAALRAESLAS